MFGRSGGRNRIFKNFFFFLKKHNIFMEKLDFFERFFFKITFVKIELYDVCITRWKSLSK